MPFENVGKNQELDWLSMGISETITNDLLSIPGIVLVERLQIRNVLEEQKLQLTGLVDEKTAIEVGKMIGADILVLGAYQKSAETLRLTSRFVDVETGSVIQSTKATGPMDKVFDLQDAIVTGLALNLKIELKKQELDKITQQPTKSIEAYSHFGKGALLQAKLDGPGSLEELKKASDIDPNFKAAKDKFKEVFWSLDEGNYWVYDMRGNIPGVFSSQKMDRQVTRKAGPTQVMKDASAFSYYREMNAIEGKAGSKERTGEFFTKGVNGIMLAGNYFAFLKKDGKTAATEYFYEHSPSPLYFPYDLKSGTQWTNKYITNVQTPVGPHQAEVYETLTVGKKEEVSVPAGKFTCLPISMTAQWRGEIENEDRELTLWFAPGVGIVKSVIVTYQVNKLGVRKEKAFWDFHEELTQYRIQ
nr:hypothetical protein [Desulfobulbaceae bacterium]